MRIEYPEGATPLDAGEIEGLRLPHISTREQLNALEQENILIAELKFLRQKKREILSEKFLLKLHHQMIGNVWKWSGRFRLSDKNIGDPFWEVAVKVRGLCEDTKLWIESNSEPADQIAARFHHRLVFIHPFANGNGRHVRMLTDLLLVHLMGKPRFTWGGADLVNAGSMRTRYLEALRAADRRDYSLLNSFVRS
jgi:Fic-DOC domain mobile mystery protein B